MLSRESRACDGSMEPAWLQRKPSSQPQRHGGPLWPASGDRRSEIAQKRPQVRSECRSKSQSVSLEWAPPTRLQTNTGASGVHRFWQSPSRLRTLRTGCTKPDLCALSITRVIYGRPEVRSKGICPEKLRTRLGFAQDSDVLAQAVTALRWARPRNCSRMTVPCARPAKRNDSGRLPWGGNRANPPPGC